MLMFIFFYKLFYFDRFFLESTIFNGSSSFEIIQYFIDVFVSKSDFSFGGMAFP